jgi:K+-transporting ATPase KdpF subunit
MDALTFLSAIVTLALFFYLVCALLKPEIFP